MLSGLLYGTVGYFGTLLLAENFTVPSMLFWRFAFATTLVAPFAIWSLYKYPLPTSSSLIIVFMLGAIFYSASTATYFLGSKDIGTGLCMVIFFSFPAFVVLIEWIVRGKRPGKATISSVLIILFGCALIGSKQFESLHGWGIFWALVSAFTFAFYIIGSHKVAGEMNPAMSTFLVCCGNMLALYAMTRIDGNFSAPEVTKHWLLFIAVAVIATALPIVFFLAGIKYISASKASVLSVLEPVATIAIGVILLAEPITYPEIIGTILILVGTIIVQLEEYPDTKGSLTLN